MNRPATAFSIAFSSIAVVLVALLTAGAHSAPPASKVGRLAGAGHIGAPRIADAPADSPSRNALAHAPAFAAPGRAAAAPAYPLYRWPLERNLHDGLLVVNYVDHDPSAGVLDYEGSEHTYDTHAGTDYVLYNFRLMDRGCRIYAASPGIVVYIGAAAPGAFDRSCTFDWPDDGNWVWIDNGDGSYSEYYHMRAWSLTVQLGESVQTGDLLGLVGSSGYATQPHLHFETGDYQSGPYQPRDPYHGPDNPLPSLWQSQEDYEGDDPLWFADLGVFADSAVGGSVFNTTYCDVVEGIQAPVVFGIHEPHLDTWFQFQGNVADTFLVEVRRPDGTVWASYGDTLSYDARFDWFWVYWFWDGNVDPSDYGTWTLRAYANGALSREEQFEVGPETIYGPRLAKAGRSFRVNGLAQSDTLRLTPLSPPVTFSLPDAPPFVTLQDSVVTIGPSSGQRGPSSSRSWRWTKRHALTRLCITWSI